MRYRITQKRTLRFQGPGWFGAPGAPNLPLLSSERLVFKDHPIWLWLTGLFVTFIGFWTPNKVWERLLFGLAGVAILGFASILTVTVDQVRRTLNLRYRSIFRGWMNVLPLSDIGFVNVSEDWEGERLYRIELILRTGETVPLRSIYSTGKRRKERRAEQIRSLL